MTNGTHDTRTADALTRRPDLTSQPGQHGWQHEVRDRTRTLGSI